MRKKFPLHLQLFALVLVRLVSSRRGKVIDIFNQNSGEDIAEIKNEGNFACCWYDVDEGYSSTSTSNLYQNLLSLKSSIKMYFPFLRRLSVRKWDKDANGIVTIPYNFRDMNEYEKSEIDAVYEAMWRIGNNTCIRFKKRVNERDYVEIKNDYNQGCYANLGRSRGKGEVQLEANDIATCMLPHIVLHELMHVIGLWHEHVRNDRDEHIVVNYGNIPRSHWSQFSKIIPDVLPTHMPYDYKSIMHYGKTAFSHDGQSITMMTNDPAYQDVIGRQKDASPSDYQKICAMYKCSECRGASSRDAKPFNAIEDSRSIFIVPTPITRRPNLSGIPNKLLQSMLCLLILLLL